MTQDEWLQVAATIDATWPNADLPTETIKAWYRQLADLDGDAVAEAVAALAVEPGRRFPPTLAEIRAAAEPPPDYEDALAELDRLLRRHGWYEGRPKIDDPALARWVRSFGWRRLHDLDLTDPTFRAQFRDSYRRAVERVRSDEARARAAGRLDAHRQEIAELTAGDPDGQTLDVVDGRDRRESGTSIVPREARR